MKGRGWWLSLARSLGFALCAALLCRVFAPTFRPGPVSILVAPPTRVTSAPKPTMEPTATATPTPSAPERKKRAGVDALIVALRDFDSYTGDARLYNREGESYGFDARKVARVERRIEARLRRLLRQGVDLNGFGSDGRTPLSSAAATEGNPNPLKLALRFGCDPNRRTENHETPLEATFVYSETTYFNTEAARELLKAGANPNALFASGQTPLLAAATLDYREDDGVALLLRAGANPNLADKKGITPLMSAVGTSNLGYGYGRRRGGAIGSSLQLLLNAGANPNARDNRGQTVLMHAVAYDAETEFYADSSGEPSTRTQHLGSYNAEAVKLLLQRGANVNARDNLGRTALHHAVLLDANESSEDARIINLRLKTMRVLLDNGANLEARDNLGRTPLLCALETYYASATDAQTAILPLRLLIARGANVSARDTKGRSALDLAREEPVVTQLLREHGAK